MYKYLITICSMIIALMSCNKLEELTPESTNPQHSYSIHIQHIDASMYIRIGDNTYNISTSDGHGVKTYFVDKPCDIDIMLYSGRATYKIVNYNNNTVYKGNFDNNRFLYTYLK